MAGVIRATPSPHSLKFRQMTNLDRSGVSKIFPSNALFISIVIYALVEVRAEWIPISAGGSADPAIGGWCGISLHILIPYLSCPH